jgi:hypothetical protein
MSILLREGFGNLTDGTHTAGVTREILGEQWGSYSNNFVITDRADGRKWISIASTRNVNLVSGGFGDQTEVAVGWRMIRDTEVLATLFLLTKAGVSGVGGVQIDANGYLQWSYHNANWPALNITAVATSPVPKDTETYCEVRVYLAASPNGWVKFYLNGALVNEVTGIQTWNSATNDVANSIQWLYGASDQSAPSTWLLGDLIVHNDASPIGDAGVYYKAVDGDVGTPDFTPSAVGANNLMLDEIGPDEDTTYNESAGTAGHRDQFSGPGLTGMTILEVCALVRARKTSTGTATLLLGMEEGVTEDQSAAKALSDDYLTLLEGWATNPDTLAAWTAQEATDALISYEVGA